MSRTVKNILFIMCDQLRFDYLGCAGHPHLHTPNIDALARRGVRFNRAYAQSPVCGASRMCFYTGRYVHSHGASWNNMPLKVGERTIGDYLRPLGVRTVLVGKTHMRADTEGMARLGIDPASEIGVLVSECGFEPFERDDGLYGTGPDGRYDEREPRYNDYLRDLGYDGDNPWHDWANAAADDDGKLLSGWFLKNAGRPARIPDEHSETPYMTRRAMDFITEAGDGPWCLHLSYIKPHWPYIVPAPYHALYGPDDVLPAVRAEIERGNHAHPVFRAFMDHCVARAFSRDDVRRAVIPAYMGLIRQIDDQLGVLFQFLQERGLFDDTMIVLTSDHGDYLGDHWLGEKDLFHEPSVKIPLIVYDPSKAADTARGTVCEALTESIDLLPTFLEALGGDPQPHRLEGLSLTPFLHGQTPRDWRHYAISEYDYSQLPAARALGTEPSGSRLFMVADKRWKYVHAEGFRPMLFDLDNDPDEFIDVGDDRDYEDVRVTMEAALRRWALRVSQRTTISDAEIRDKRDRPAADGILIGYRDADELPDPLRRPYRKILEKRD
jgi:arylsulfatase A-like enzyme